jgi:predicted O-methyltransferase YrrM
MIIRTLLCILALGYASHNLHAQTLPPPYSDINILPYDGQSMYRHAPHLERLIREHSVEVIVEVGCWLGASTRHMASQLPEGGKVYAVDHWLGSIENQPGEWCYFPVLPILYQQFLSNVVHQGLTEKIIPVRMASLEAARTLKVVPDLIYIDAAHDTESVYQDLRAWYPFLQPQGVMCGDDADWESVSAAVTRFAREKDLKVFVSEGFWQLLK